MKLHYNRDIIRQRRKKETYATGPWQIYNDWLTLWAELERLQQAVAEVVGEKGGSKTDE